MKIDLQGFAALSAIGLVSLALSACGAKGSSSANRGRPVPVAERLPSDAAEREGAIRFLEGRIKKDAEDFIAYNKLSAYYRQIIRETGDFAYLDLASRAARASLAVLPPEQNTGGLTELAYVEFASHDFLAARDHAKRLIELDPGKAYPFQLLGDAFLELGEYEKAERAFHKAARCAGSTQGLTRSAIEQRFARLDFLHGRTDSAQRHFVAAITAALAGPFPPRETVAWCRWQLGELAFAAGDYPAAERHYRDALITFPDYFRALSSLGRVRAARGDITGAIAEYERAIHVFPDSAFIAALGDLYQIAGRTKDATIQYDLVEHIGRLSTSNGVLYNRQLASFYADHGIRLVEAVLMAEGELRVRKDIYGYDALAWSYYKSVRVAEAKSTMRQALQLGTKDALLLFHTGMIEAAVGERESARTYLKQALVLSPRFHPIHWKTASETLARLGGQ